MDDIISYKEVQDNYKEQVKDYYYNKKFLKSCIKETFDNIEFIEGDASDPGYYSILCNNMRTVSKNMNSNKILFDSNNLRMKKEREKLFKLVNYVNKSFSHIENKSLFRLNNKQIDLLDEINIYFLCDDDMKKYLKLKLKDLSFVSQKVMLLNDDIFCTVVNNVYTYYLCKENTYDSNNENEPYDLPISKIYKDLMDFGITKDYQRSKIIVRFKPDFRSSILVFGSGINVSTGSPNNKMADFLAKLLVRQFRLNCGFYDLDIAVSACQNKVAAAKIRFGLCLKLLAHRYGKDIVQYNPSTFAGAIVKIPNINDIKEDIDNITLLVFGTRKIICVGAKNEQNLIQAYLKIYEMLLNCKRTPQNIQLENELIKQQQNNENKINIDGEFNDVKPSYSSPIRGNGRGRGRGRRGSKKLNILNRIENKSFNKTPSLKKRGRPRKN